MGPGNHDLSHAFGGLNLGTEAKGGEKHCDYPGQEKVYVRPRPLRQRTSMGTAGPTDPTEEEVAYEEGRRAAERALQNYRQRMAEAKNQSPDTIPAHVMAT